MEEKSVLNISSYRFVALEGDLDALRSKLYEKCEELGLRGTILLSREGTNIMLAGNAEAIGAIHAYLGELDAGLKDLDFKESWSVDIPFKRLLVKVKKELIRLDMPEIQPLHESGVHITPEELKALYESGEDFTVLDTRNDYEVRMGTFKNAIDMNIKNFTDFPSRLEEIAAEDEAIKEKPLVMFCTGGIRCERASLVAERQGFKKVMQLEGGIIRYFEKVGGDHWEGECFVFDRRVGLLPTLEESDAVLCFACGDPLSGDDLASDKYQPLISCPYCYDKDLKGKAMHRAKSMGLVKTAKSKKSESDVAGRSF